MTNVQIDPNAKAQGAIERLKMAWPERRTELFNARTLAAIADNKPQLEETLKKFPNSGDVLAKLCKIKIDEIPANAPFDDPVARNFLHFFDHAFKCLTFKHGYLPAGIISAPCRRKGLGVDVNQRVKKAVDLIDVLGVYLNKKGDPWLKTRVLFLDRVMETPHYLYGDGWVQDTISKYLSSNEEWGRSVFLGTVTLLKCEDRWRSRDIKYLFEYVDFSNEPFQDMIRGSYKFLMGISLKRNDEQNFVRAFKGFSQNLLIDIKNGKTNYKMEYKDFESKEKAFMKKFPKNKEVPEIFEKIPNPYPAKVRNRGSNCDHELLI